VRIDVSLTSIFLCPINLGKRFLADRDVIEEDIYCLKNAIKVTSNYLIAFPVRLAYV